jgi:hypothetical protein
MIDTSQGYISFSSVTDMFSSSNESYVSIYPNDSKSYLIGFLKKINDGHRIINDMCETLDDTYSIISGSSKPSCDYNISYIQDSGIMVYFVNENIKKFFLKEKKNFCKLEKTECGELTIILKIFDLINYGVKISLLNLDYNTLIINLNIIDFDSLFSLYKSSLFNDEIILNITLSKQKANVILTKEKNRIHAELNKISLSRVSDNINTWVGGPVKNIFTYTGDTISETIESLIPNLSMDIKIIIILVLFLVLRSKC